MIRFIDLGDQIYCDEDSRSFAFFDTITDTFESFDGTFYWDTWDEFEQDFRAANEVFTPEVKKDLERHRGLAQHWIDHDKPA